MSGVNWMRLKPVRSDFGVHIIQVTAIKPASKQEFSAVKDEIAGELRTQAAGRLFAEQAEQFANMVYEQADSLEPVARELGLEYEMVKVTDINAIMGFGVMMTPALAVDGQVKVVGKVPSPEEIKKLLA